MKTHQLNKSSRHFETIRERKFEFTSNVGTSFNMYVDDRYCILDLTSIDPDYNRSIKHIRHIEVRCINTMELIHDRHFESSLYIRREYKGGIIVAETKNDKGERSLVVWDVHNNRITPIRNFTNPNQPKSIFMAHFTNYHIIFWHEECSENIKLFKTIQGTATPTELSVQNFNPFNSRASARKFLHCDGIQAFGIKYERGYKLAVVDLIGKEVIRHFVNIMYVNITLCTLLN